MEFQVPTEPSIVTLLAIAVYFATIGKIGRLRSKLEIAPPKMTGDPAFERAVRVQANTLEQMIMFLPCLWLAALTWNSLYASIIGGLWVIGRILYAMGYYQEAKRRSMGFVIGLIANILLFLAAIYGLF